MMISNDMKTDTAFKLHYITIIQTLITSLYILTYMNPTEYENIILGFIFYAYSTINFITYIWIHYNSAIQYNNFYITIKMINIINVIISINICITLTYKLIHISNFGFNLIMYNNIILFLSSIFVFMM